jgi:transposase, IS30 family
LETYLTRGYTYKEIGVQIKKSEGAISEELRKYSVRGVYTADKAHTKATVRHKRARRQGKKIVRHKDTQKEVERLLLDDQSPEMISGRLKTHLRTLVSVSARVIRRYIRSVYGRRIESHRQKVFKKYRKRTRLPVHKDGRRMIDKRPRIVATRNRIGDAEGDFLAPGKGGKGLILNVTDRKSRAPFFEKVYPVSLRTVMNAFVRIQKRFPELKTLTLDNDILFVMHKDLERKLGIRIYFCYPGRPYEKGSNENRNKIVRRYIPKGADIAPISKTTIKNLEAKLQRRIMKCLNYLTPREVLEQHRTRTKKHR